jgi:hypothetical protein
MKPWKSISVLRDQLQSHLDQFDWYCKFREFNHFPLDQQRKAQIWLSIAMAIGFLIGWIIPPASTCSIVQQQAKR